MGHAGSPWVSTLKFDIEIDIDIERWPKSITFCIIAQKNENHVNVSMESYYTSKVVMFMLKQESKCT